MNPTEHKSKPTRIYLFTQLRTMSHLFMKLVSTYPGTERLDYPYMLASTIGPEKINVEDFNAWMKFDLESDLVKNSTFQNQFDIVREFIAKTEEEGKYPIVKDAFGSTAMLTPDAAHPNRPTTKVPVIIDKAAPTDADSIFDKSLAKTIFLPDSFLASITPVILIRHPGRTLPSLTRAFGASGDLHPGDHSFERFASYTPARQLFDYLSAGKIKPILIDSDDLISDPEGMMGKFCDAIGWDKTQIKYTWQAEINPAASVVQNEQIADAFFEGIQTSTGVRRPEQPLVLPDLDVELSKWIKEFGEEQARIMQTLVKESVDDYLYLRQYRL